jgi:hypothetical protein
METGAISTASPARQSRRRRNHPGNRQKGPQLAGFCDLTKRLRSPEFAKSRPICRKSPGATANIPVFGKRTSEIGFDRHWVARFAVEFGLFSSLSWRRLRALQELPRGRAGRLPRCKTTAPSAFSGIADLATSSSRRCAIAQIASRRDRIRIALGFRRRFERFSRE